MGVVSRARNAKLILSVQDVLRAKSLIHLAQFAKQAPSGAETKIHETDTEEPFALSPIQTMYMKSAIKHDGEGRLHQSFSLAVSRQVTLDTIKRAMDSIVRRHSMLRSRFSRKPDGNWEQRNIKVEAQLNQLQIILLTFVLDGTYGLSLFRTHSAHTA